MRAVPKSFEELSKQGYTFLRKHGDDTFMPRIFREEEAEAQREAQTYPRSSSELTTELEQEPVDPEFTQTHVVTGRYVCVTDVGGTLTQCYQRGDCSSSSWRVSPSWDSTEGT